MSLYEINLQREILREKSAEILADFNKYMRENNINYSNNEVKNPIVALYYNVIEIYNNIFTPKYKDILKLEAVNGKLDLAKEILKNSYLERENYIKFKEFYEEYTKLSFLDFEELISNAKDEKEKLFFNMLLQYSMENNFNKVLRKEKY